MDGQISPNHAVPLKRLYVRYVLFDCIDGIRQWLISISTSLARDCDGREGGRENDTYCLHVDRIVLLRRPLGIYIMINYQGTCQVANIPENLSYERFDVESVELNN